MKPTVIEPMAITRLRPFPGSRRTHSRKQIRQIADSVARFGFTNPVLIGEDNEVIAGHGRLEAAKLLGLKSVPTLRLSSLDAAERRAYVLADNKLALNARWDRGALAVELKALADVQFDAEVTGFSCAEIELALEEPRRIAAAPPKPRSVLPPPQAAVTRRDDFWLIDRHRVLCADPFKRPRPARHDRRHPRAGTATRDRSSGTAGGGD